MLIRCSFWNVSFCNLITIHIIITSICIYIYILYIYILIDDIWWHYINSIWSINVALRLMNTLSLNIETQCTDFRTSSAQQDCYATHRFSKALEEWGFQRTWSMIENYGRHCWILLLSFLSFCISVSFTAEIRLWFSRTRLVLKVHPPATAGDPAATQDKKPWWNKMMRKWWENHQILGHLKPKVRGRYLSTFR